MSLVLDAVARRAIEAPTLPILTGGARPLDGLGLMQAVTATAAGIAAAAPGEGPVALMLDNGPAWVICDLALIQLGRPCVPVPPFFTLDQRAHALADAGAAAIIAPEGEGAALDIAGDRVVVTRLNNAPRALPAGTAKITYTSGSTGQPKGVCLSLAQMEALAASLVTVLGHRPQSVHMPVLPLSILLENVAGLYGALLADGVYLALPAAQVGLANPFQPDFARLALAAQSRDASSLILVPELLRGLIAAKSALRLSMPALNLVAVGGAKVAPALLDAALAAGVPVFEGYGLSECASVVALNTPSASRPGTVGKVLPHHQVEIAADGEIVVTSKTFLGYVGDQPRTGPYRTGDLGRFDADGFLIIEGRASNLIINSFGRNIAPEWVESELLAQPEIAQALVFGEGQPALGALIVPSAAGLGTSAITDAVARANAQLPAYAHVARWRITPPFDPRRGQATGNGRPRRPVLLADYADFVTQSGAADAVLS